MRVFSIITVLCLAACGDSGGGVDAPPGGPDGPPDGPPTPATCATYCATIGTNCTGAANLQFGNSSDCAASCGAWMQGVTGEMANNTLSCRDYHAGAAAASPGIHCRHAGPGGDDMCGSNCEGFCTLVLDACTGGNIAYANLNQCMTACAGFATSPAYSANEMSGDTFACRLYHATAASTAPGTHCAHTEEVGGINFPCQ